MSADLMLRRIGSLSGAQKLVLVGIGGHGAAGKTTLAQQVSGAQLIGTGEFWDGEGFDLARLLREALRPLARGEVAHYRAFSWFSRTLESDRRTVLPEGVVIVEGVCALHRTLRHSYDLRVWVEAPRDVRLARAVAREGEQSRSVWEDVWMPREDAYVERDNPSAIADLVVDGSRAPWSTDEGTSV